MKIFRKIFGKLAVQGFLEKRLGCPLGDETAIQRRLSHFSTLSGGAGFRVPPLEPRRNAQGLTRGDRKRLLRAQANAKAAAQIAVGQIR